LRAIREDLLEIGRLGGPAGRNLVTGGPWIRQHTTRLLPRGLGPNRPFKKNSRWHGPLRYGTRVVRVRHTFPSGRVGVAPLVFLCPGGPFVVGPVDPYELLGRPFLRSAPRALGGRTGRRAAWPLTRSAWPSRRAAPKHRIFHRVFHEVCPIRRLGRRTGGGPDRFVRRGAGLFRGEPLAGRFSYPVPEGRRGHVRRCFFGMRSPSVDVG